MMVCRRALLGSVFALAFAASVGPAPAKELTILTSVPGLNFPFFVHMLKAMEAEVTAQGATPLEADGQNNAPKQTADVEAGLTKGRGRGRARPDRRQRMAPAVSEIIDAGIPVVTSTGV